LVSDSIGGTLDAFEVDFVTQPCFPTYKWTNLTSATATGQPTPRYHAYSMAYNQFLFVYGGRDSYDRPLSDLYRYNVLTDTWNVLTPVNFNVVFETASSTASNFVLTNWGILRFGGYFRQPVMPLAYGNYDNTVMVMDPVTLRWSAVGLIAWPQYKTNVLFDRASPAPRYLSAAVFLSSKQFDWPTKFTHRNLYDQLIPSVSANYAGTIIDSLMISGGFDGSSGSTYDGSSGGFLKDVWMLRLANWSTEGSRQRQQLYLEQRCAWRSNSAALSRGVQNCTTSGDNQLCDLRDLLMLGWCGQYNQTLS